MEALDPFFIKEFVGDGVRITYMGWRRLFIIEEPIYKELCVELLNIFRSRKREEIHDTGKFNFCLGGERRECSMAELT